MLLAQNRFLLAQNEIAYLANKKQTTDTSVWERQQFARFILRSFGSRWFLLQPLLQEFCLLESLPERMSEFSLAGPLVTRQNTTHLRYREKVSSTNPRERESVAVSVLLSLRSLLISSFETMPYCGTARQFLWNWDKRSPEVSYGVCGLTGCRCNGEIVLFSAYRFLMFSFFREYGLSSLHETQKSVLTSSFICIHS